MEKLQQNSQKSKTYFTIEKDIWLLKECIAQNPYQPGKEKWKDVLKNLKENYSVEILERTARERINTLIVKLQKEELHCRSGSEEKNNERKTLIYEIVDMKEEMIAQVIAEDSEKEKTNNKAQYVEANQIRNEAVARYGKDSPSEPTSIRRKRSAVLTAEEELIMKKQQAEIELEEKKLCYNTNKN